MEKRGERKPAAGEGGGGSSQRAFRTPEGDFGQKAESALPDMRGTPPDPRGTAQADRLLLLVDGDCAMCRGITRFAAKRDRRDRLRFAALDSPAGRELTFRLGLSLPPAGSFVLICGAAAWTRSEAAVRTLAALDPPWPAVAAALRLVPAKLRDAAYDAVAARRHRLAGLARASQCPAAPDERVRRRLLDAESWHGQAADGGRDVYRGEERT